MNNKKIAIIILVLIVIIIVVLTRKKQPLLAPVVEPKATITNATEKINLEVPIAPEIEVEEQLAPTNVVIKSKVPRFKGAISLADFLDGAAPIPDFDLNGLINETLEAFRKNISKEEKLALMQKIENVNHPDIIPVILEALKETDPDILDCAMQSIILMDDPAVMPAVLVALENENPQIRIDAISSLLLIESDTINQALLKGINDPDPEVREEVLTVLITQAQPYILPTLRETIKYNDSDIQNETISVLEEVPSPDAITLIIDSGLLSDFESVRVNSIEALQDLSGKKYESLNEWQDWWESTSSKCPNNGDRIDWEDWWDNYSAK